MAAHFCISNPCTICYPQLANQQYPWHFTSEPNCFEGQVLVAPIHDYKQIEHPRGEYIYLACSRCGKTIERDLRTLKE